MATKFPKFSQDLAQDPTTRRIWYGIATAHDFELHDGMTEENLYQKIFASHFGRLAIIFTNHGQNAPIEKWRWYKSSEQFNETHLWGLLDSMIENGYVPFPHTGLLQTANAFKSK